MVQGAFLRAIVASPRNLRSKQGILLVVALLLVAVVLIRTAWICDDAYITFRTVDNFLLRVSVTPQNALQVTPDIGRDGTLKLYPLKLPAGVERLDTLEITARRGDFRYSLGHLRVI